MTNDRAKKMVVDIGHWIFQAKDLTEEELKFQMNAPLIHWCGDHSICGKWCISKKLQENSKADSQKPPFDWNDANDRKSIERIFKIQVKFTTPKKLAQIHHWFSTQLNKSLSMRITKCAPKYEHFLFSQSIFFPVSTTITIHNLGLYSFVSDFLELLHVTLSDVLLPYTTLKYINKELKKVREKYPKNKRKRAHKAKTESKHEILLQKDGKHQTWYLQVWCCIQD